MAEVTRSGTITRCSYELASSRPSRVSLDRVVRDHDLLFQEVLAQAPIAYTPIPVSEIQIPKMPGAGWRKFVPQGVKNCVRTWAERSQRSL